MNNLKVSKVVHPVDRPSQDEWFKQYRVGSQYVEPFKYYENNHFDIETYKQNRATADRGIFSGIFKLLTTTFTWVG